MNNVKIKVGFVWPGAVAWVPHANLILVKNAKLAKNIRLIAHEICHCSQAKQLGPLFIPIYILRWVFAGFSYYNHPMEIEARAAELDPKYIEWAKETIKKNFN
jgi:hypothetical protein